VLSPLYRGTGFEPVTLLLPALRVPRLSASLGRALPLLPLSFSNLPNLSLPSRQ